MQGLSSEHGAPRASISCCPHASSQTSAKIQVRQEATSHDKAPSAVRKQAQAVANAEPQGVCPLLAGWAVGIWRDPASSLRNPPTQPPAVSPSAQCS